MIGSHDSFTYLPANNSAVNLISRFWRTQIMTITEQYAKGVRFFDVRVKREVDEDGKTKWRTCHGLAEFPKTFSSLKSICTYFTNTLKGCSFRIWLEKGSDEDWTYFKEEIEPLVPKYKNLLQVVRKKPETIYLQRYNADLKYYCCKMEQFSNYAKGIYTNPIKDWAQGNNPLITKAMIEDPNVIYFMDYATNDFNKE